VAELILWVVSAAVVVTAGVAINAGINAGTVPEVVNFEDTGENGVLKQINTLTDVDVIAIATGSDNKVRLPSSKSIKTSIQMSYETPQIMTTITLPPVPTPTHHPEEVSKTYVIICSNADILSSV
jgi:hypothetical protein